MKRNGELVNGRGTYQISKLRAALEHCKSFRGAIDVGAHVGLWAMHLVRRFQFVDAFEPVAAFRECFRQNLGTQPNCMLHSFALGATWGSVAMALDPADSGGTHVAGAGDIEMRPLDSFAWRNIDFIKIDCEGYELEVLKGAEMMLRENRPCVCVEQKPHKLKPNFGIDGAPAVEYLQRLGAKVKRVMSGDYILCWD